MDSMREKIEKRAYEFYLARGGQPGNHEEDWARAEAEIKAEMAAKEKQAKSKEQAAPKQEAPKAAPKQEAPKAAPKQEAPKAAPKQEAPKAAPKQEARKSKKKLLQLPLQRKRQLKRNPPDIRGLIWRAVQVSCPQLFLF